MKRLMPVMVLVSLFALIALQIPAHSNVGTGPWVDAYYPAYDSLQTPPPQNIDYRAITHLLFFAAAPNTDGSLDTSEYNLAGNSSTVISTAHTNGAKCLIVIGGGGAGPNFSVAIQPATQATLISNIVSFCVSQGYDGVDIDFEDSDFTGTNDIPNYESFIENLRAAMTSAKSGLLLTAAAEPYGVPSVFNTLQGYFDQINVMTYDLSGDWPGWSSWFNSPLYNCGLSFSNGRAFPSVDNVVGSYEAAGIPNSKLGIGMAFYGYDWTGVSGPDQSLGNGSVGVGAVTYYAIMTQYYTASSYNWDSCADAPYLNLGSQFISYDDTRLEALKVDYIKAQGLGGCICWNTDQEYMGNSVTGDAQQPLLAAIYHEIVTDWSNSAPAAPAGLTAAAGNAQIALNWSTSTGATSYNVYRGTISGGESTTPVATGLTGASYTNTGLTNGTTYYYEVSAVNSNGTSAMSNEASGTPVAPTVPAAPTGLAATSGNALVSLTWSASTGATSYNVYRGTTSGGESTTAIATGLTSTSYTNTGLTNGTTYYYKVAAVNSVGTSSLSTEASSTPQAPPAPSAPSGLSATAGNAQVSLSWTAGANATSYNIYRGTTAGGESATAIATGVTGASYTNTGLTNGTTYYYKVASVNSVGTSSMSNEASATPTAPAPSAPSGLAAAASNAQVSLTWTAGANATSYNVYRGTSSGGESATAIATGITTTSYTNAGLTNGTTYYYEVASVNSVGTSAKSNEASAKPSAGTSGPVSIDCGGGASGSFIADTDFTGGSTGSTSAAINTSWLTSPAPAQTVLQTQRVGQCTYVLGGFTPGTAHQITVYYVEETATGKGQREFNVLLQGSAQATNFDIYATTGAQNWAYQTNYGATADSNGNITIEFQTGAAGVPCVSAIVVAS